MTNREDEQKVRELHAKGFSVRAIARTLHLHRRSVKRVLAAGGGPVRREPPAARPSMFDPHRVWILGQLERYPNLTAQRVYSMLRNERGFTGGASSVREYVAQLRPRLTRADFTLKFAPGESAQVDWGQWGSVDVEGTPRRLSFFVCVLAHSRMLYAELALGEAMEHWLNCHRNAFEFFGGVPEKVRVDRCKTAVCGVDSTGQPVITPQYRAFARHYGFAVDACDAYCPKQKGRVENGVKYLKSAFFAGRPPTPFPVLQAALRDWLANEANQRVHSSTGKRPAELFLTEEKPRLKPLPPMPADCAVETQAVSDSRFRVTVDTNRYSVPSAFASRRLILRRDAERIVLLSPVERKPLAVHPRCYGRKQDRLVPEHERELILATRHARDKRLLETFLTLGSASEAYLAALQERRPDWRSHLRRINALAEVYGRDETGRIVADALEHRAFGSDYVQNILSFRARLRPEPGPLHVTRRSDLLELSLPEPNLDVYTGKENTP
jgi:transposase